MVLLGVRALAQQANVSHSTGTLFARGASIPVVANGPALMHVTAFVFAAFAFSLVWSLPWVLRRGRLPICQTGKTTICAIAHTTIL